MRFAGRLASASSPSPWRRSVAALALVAAAAAVVGAGETRASASAAPSEGDLAAAAPGRTAPAAGAEAIDPEPALGDARARWGGAGASTPPAQDPASAAAAAEALAARGAIDELDLGPTLLRTLAVLALVVGLIYLVLNVGLRRLLGVAATATARASAVALVERVPLDPKHTLFVVRAGSEVLLVGGAEGSLALLTKLDPTVLEGSRRSIASAGVVQSPLVQALFGKRRGSGALAATAAPAAAGSTSSQSAAPPCSPSASAGVAPAQPGAGAPIVESPSS